MRWATCIQAPPSVMTVTVMTDWKTVADELYMFIVGLMAGSAYLNGKDEAAALDRARFVYDECVKANTTATEQESDD